MNKAIQLYRNLSSLYRNAYGGLTPATWWLSLVMLVNRCGTMVVPFMTLYLTESKHVSIGKATMVMAIFGAGAVCGGFIGGRLTDRIGFYPVQLITLAGGGIMFIVLGLISSYPLICITTFFLSLVNESFRPANSTAIATYSREDNRTRSYSLNRLSTNLGWALGGTLGGFIASRNYHLLFWIDGCTNILAAVLLRAVLAPKRNPATPKADKKELVRDRANSAYFDKVYIAFIVLSTAFAYCFFQMFSTMPVYYRKVLHLREDTIGLIMALNGLLIALFEMVIIFRLEGKRNSLFYISIGTTLVGTSFLLFNIMPGAISLAFTSMLIITAGEVFSMPFMNTFWVSRTTAVNRGQYAGLYTVAWASAQVLGPGTGGQIAEHWGFDTLWWIIGSVSVLTAIGYKWLEYRVNRQKTVKAI
jgi:predicted MFS family arabinose efflux permease